MLISLKSHKKFRHKESYRDIRYNSIYSDMKEYSGEYGKVSLQNSKNERSENLIEIKRKLLLFESQYKAPYDERILENNKRINFKNHQRIKMREYK